MRIPTLALATQLIASPSFAMPATIQSTDLIGPLIEGFSEIDFDVDGLNGIVLDGQRLTADIQFSDDLVARVTTRDLVLVMGINTDAGGFPGFPTDSSGFIFGLPGMQDAGEAMSSRGEVIVGLVVFEPLRYRDITGLHLDFVAPTGGHTVTGARLRLAVNDEWGNVQIGTIAQLPESGGLLMFAVGGLLTLVRRRTA
jgi:hypothetical protein